MMATHNGSRNHSIFAMAGSPPKPPPPTLAAGSSSPKPPPPTFISHPSYKELFNHLHQRVVSGTKVDFIHEADLYSADPYLLTKDHLPATSKSRERAWYFFTLLRPKGQTQNLMKRNVDDGREGTWTSGGNMETVKDVFSNGQRLIGCVRRFTFEEKVRGNRVQSAWRMKELRLEPNEGGQEAGSSNLLALCKVYRKPNAEADDESSMAAAKEDGEAPAASAVVTTGRKGADEEIGTETAGGTGRKRKAGDKDSGAETVASSPERQKKADGKSADAATTREIFADAKDPNPHDAAEKAEQEEPRLQRDSRFYDFLGDSSAPLDDAPEEAEQEPRDSRETPFYDFFSDPQNPKKG